MRAGPLVVVVLALVSACSPDEPGVVAVVPEPLRPEPELAPEPLIEVGPNQVVVTTVRESQAEHIVTNEIVSTGADGAAFQVDVERAASSSDVIPLIPQIPRRLVFECTDGVMFAVRMLGNRLELYPPGMPAAGFLGLAKVPSVSGVYYRAGDVEFRSKDDLATLEMGRERYVDCVANPAAATWQDPLTLNSEQEQRLRAVEQNR